MKRRKLLLALLILLLAGGIVGWRLYTLRERALLSRPLIAAVKAGDIAQAKSLLDRGADPDARDTPDVPMGLFDFLKDLFDRKKRAERENYPTALLLAVAEPTEPGFSDLPMIDKKRAAMVTLLLERGADINARNKDGVTALIRACNTWYTDSPIALLLLEHGAKVNLKDAQTRTPLFYAMENNRYNLYAPLVERGADVNTRNSTGDTLLMLVTQQGDLRLVETLLARGAEANTGNNGKTPLLIAFDLPKQDDDEGPYDDAGAPSAQTSCDMMRLLLQHGADPNVEYKAEDGEIRMPLLWRAIDDNRTDAVKLLLDAGANINITDKSQTTLMYAVMQRNAEIVRLLLERGKQTQPLLNLNAQDDAGQTALMIAAYDGDTDIVRLLLQYGADPRLRDREDFTALRYAADSPDIAALLRTIDTER